MPKKAKQVLSEDTLKPLPPNIFLYIQLARIDKLPNIIDPLEIHLDQGGSLIIKCVEQYNTEGIISQDEFHLKPTYTLVLQQDNLDRINHASDNPLLIKLYMRKTAEPPDYEEEEMDLEIQSSQLLNMLLDTIELNNDEKEIFNYVEPVVEMVLLSVGYLDIIKLFGRHRCMLREELTLYPVPECPMELRCAVSTEWHLYTLVPIAKQLTFTNMAFITFESIYNLKEEDSLDVDALNVQLSFRSMLPMDRNEYHVIPWCSYSKFTETIIDMQDYRHVFECFRNSVPNSSCTGLKSAMEVQKHQLFSKLMRSENMDVNFDLIKTNEDLALVCNTFHRFLLTNTMSDILFATLAWRRYVIVVDVWTAVAIEKKVGKKVIKEMANQKVFTGVLDPAILIFPGVQSIRFAVELKNVGPKKKVRNTRATTMAYVDKPTFCIIKICLLAPLGDVYEELKVFRDTFISQNRLLFCDNIPPNQQPPSIAMLQRITYASFDGFMRDTIRYIVNRKVHSVEDKKAHFCCALQNLTNIILKLMGCDFNLRERTTTNVQFTNLCALAFNELEERVHNMLENIAEEGFDELIVDQNLKNEELIEYMNAIKFLIAAGDTRMANFLYEKEKLNNSANLFIFDLIAKMERNDFAGAKKYLNTNRSESTSEYEYILGWINLYLEYVGTRDDSDPAISANSNECLLNSISMFAQRNSCQLDGWILLYCYYKRFKYAAGFNYARWRFESQLRSSRASISKAPISLWGIFLNVKPQFKRERGTIFYDCFKMFVRLGLYEFGQVVFEEMQEECSREERYLIGTQLKILLNQLEDDFWVTTFSTESGDTSEMDGFNAQLNGSVEYYRGNLEAAAEYYARTLDLPITDTDRDLFCLSKLRLAYLSFDAGNYQQAIDALSKMNGIKVLGLVINYLMGKSYYKLDDLHKALECFINCTRFNSHVPDVWGFLALINMQLGNNWNAISCWKYARIDPTKSINDETIFEGLDKIDIDSIDLFIDTPSPNNDSIEDDD